MAVVKTLNLALKFLLELAAIAAFAYWGATASGRWLAVALAIVAPTTAVVLWGLLAAPRSARRLPTSLRVPFELTVFGLAVAALLAAGSGRAALVLAVAVVVNTILLTVLRQLAA